MAITKLVSGSLGTGVGGKVLQVVEGFTTDSTTFSSTTYVDVGLSASITPSSSSNKILVLVNCMNMKNNTSTGGSSKIRIMVDTGSGYSEVREYVDVLAYNDNDVNNPSPQILHSPSTTSSTTYKVQAAHYSGYSSGFARFNNRSADVAGAMRSSITLMEISV